MKHLPEVSENGKFIILVIVGVLTAIIIIGELSGLTDAFIQSFA